MSEECPLDGKKIEGLFGTAGGGKFCVPVNTDHIRGRVAGVERLMGYNLAQPKLCSTTVKQESNSDLSSLRRYNVLDLRRPDVG
jgi:hypothetical protein